MSNQLSWNIIKHFSRRNLYGFALKDVAEAFPEKSSAHLAGTLADMVKKGMLCKIYQGIYHIIPINADPETYVPDGLQVAKYLIQNKEYYIGYGSAMKIHGLALQPETGEYVVTMKQIKPAIRNFRGITFHFIQQDASRFFGFENYWINQLEQAMVSDLEKTLVDVATKPRFCGGIVEVGNAMIQSKDRKDHDKLFYYFARNGNKSAKKRFLFLSDLLGLEWNADHEMMMQELGTGFSLLDPSAPNQGKTIRKFGLKINVDPGMIKRKVLHQPLS